MVGWGGGGGGGGGGGRGGRRGKAVFESSINGYSLTCLYQNRGRV